MELSYRLRHPALISQIFHVFPTELIYTPKCCNTSWNAGTQMAKKGSVCESPFFP